MRPRMTALVAFAFIAILYATTPSASALPAPSRADVAGSQTTGVAQQVHWRRWGWGPRYYRPYAYYRPYRLYRPYRFYRPWGCHRAYRLYRPRCCA